ncbi:MAG: hypothetical protein ACRDHW_01415 [Ktedonobacteraceae bacterium]
MSEMETQPLPGGLATLVFRAYLQRYGLSILDVSLVARVRLLVVWKVTRGQPIRAEQASLIRAALFRLTGTPFRARIAVYANEAETPGWLDEILLNLTRRP